MRIVICVILAYLLSSCQGITRENKDESTEIKLSNNDTINEECQKEIINILQHFESKEHYMLASKILFAVNEECYDELSCIRKQKNFSRFSFVFSRDTAVIININEERHYVKYIEWDSLNLAPLYHNINQLVAFPLAHSEEKIIPAQLNYRNILNELMGLKFYNYKFVEPSYGFGDFLIIDSFHNGLYNMVVLNLSNSKGRNELIDFAFETSQQFNLSIIEKRSKYYNQ